MQKITLLEINCWAIVVAAVAAFVTSFVWYMVFAKELAKVSTAIAEQKPEAWKMLVEVARSLVLAFVIAYVIGLIADVNWKGAVGIGILLWIGLSAVQWVGAILWENVPLKMAAIHAGDWLVKLVLISAIVGLWRR
ncbi:MAG: DUF1761 domain-containing protein [Limisphaerales bacterium]